MLRSGLCVWVWVGEGLGSGVRVMIRVGLELALAGVRISGRYIYGFLAWLELMLGLGLWVGLGSEVYETQRHT